MGSHAAPARLARAGASTVRLLRFPCGSLLFPESVAAPGGYGATGACVATVAASSQPRSVICRGQHLRRPSPKFKRPPPVASPKPLDKSDLGRYHAGVSCGLGKGNTAREVSRISTP